MQNAKCKMQNAECKMQNEKFVGEGFALPEMQNAK